MRKECIGYTRLTNRPKSTRDMRGDGNLVYTGCQWKMLPQYYPPPGTVYYHFRKWSESTMLLFFLRSLVAEVRSKTGQKFPLPRPLVGAFLHLFRSRWNPIAPSRAKENLSTIDRPDVNIYCRTGSKYKSRQMIASRHLSTFIWLV